MRRVVSLLLTALALVLLVGCKADAFLEIHVAEAGDGTVYVAVALDPDAANRTVLYETRAGGVLPLEDLRAAGWRVTGPTQESDGRSWIRAAKPFSQLDQLSAVVDEVAGVDGPLRNFAVQHSSGDRQRSWRFSGTVDLTKGLAALSDDAVAAAFGGQALGQPAESFASQLGSPLEHLVSINVIVDLPGDLGAHNGIVGMSGQAVVAVDGPHPSSPQPSEHPGTVDGDVVRAPAVVWNPSFADRAPSELLATSSSAQLQEKLWHWSGVAAGGVGLSVLSWRLGWFAFARWRRRRLIARWEASPAARRAPSRVGVDGGRSGPVRTPPLSSPRQTSAGGLGLIVIELHGALLSEANPVDAVLAAFCRERGCTLSQPQIHELYGARILGNRTGAQFWSDLGVAGDPRWIDDVYARQFELSEQVVSFLEQARDRGVPVVVMGDGVPEWATTIRQRFNLDGLVDAWICSADVGVRVPHPDLFEAVRRISVAPPSKALVIAWHPNLLDVAGPLGFRTVRYSPAPNDVVSEHAVLRSFAEGIRPGTSTPTT